METVRNEATEIAWDGDARLARVSYAPGATLTGKDGRFLLEALGRWTTDAAGSGGANAPFGVLADATGLKGTDAEYRALASGFFRRERDRAAIALVNMGTVISVLVEMFRIGTGIRLKAFATEAEARAWLEEQARARGSEKR